MLKLRYIVDCSNLPLTVRAFSPRFFVITKSLLRIRGRLEVEGVERYGTLSLASIGPNSWTNWTSSPVALVDSDKMGENFEMH